MSNLPTVTQRGSVRARILRKVPGPRAQTLKPLLRILTVTSPWASPLTHPASISSSVKWRHKILIASQTPEYQDFADCVCVFIWRPLSFLPQGGSLGSWVGPQGLSLHRHWITFFLSGFRQVF